MTAFATDLPITSRSRAALVEGVRQRPRVDVQALVLADWLEENDDDDRGRFVRLHLRYYWARGSAREAAQAQAHALFRTRAAEWAAEVVPPADGIWEYRAAGNPMCFVVYPHPLDDSTQYWFGVHLGFRRGMVTNVWCLPRVWAAVGGRLLSREPVTTFMLRGETPYGDGLVRWVGDNRDSLGHLRCVRLHGGVNRIQRAAIRDLLRGVDVSF